MHTHTYPPSPPPPLQWVFNCVSVARQRQCLPEHDGGVRCPLAHPHRSHLPALLQVPGLRCLRGVGVPGGGHDSKQPQNPQKHALHSLLCLQVVYVYGPQTHYFCAVDGIGGSIRYVPETWMGLAQWFGVTAFLFCVHSMVSWERGRG